MILTITKATAAIDLSIIILPLLQLYNLLNLPIIISQLTSLHLLSRTSLFAALYLLCVSPFFHFFLPFFFIIYSQQWLDSSPTDPRSNSPQNNSDFSSAGGSPPLGHVSTPSIPPIAPAQSSDDEIIPTAIVIKNIPFNVKRETLLELIVRYSLIDISVDVFSRHSN